MDRQLAKRLYADHKGHCIGGWPVSDFINSGKSAVVFRSDRGSESAALKVFDPDLVERFGEAAQYQRIERELSLRGKEHPHLVRILDGGKCQRTGLLYVVMERIDSPNLADVIKKVPRDRVWPLIAQLADAAQFLEGMELAHRDIKPENIAVANDFSQATLLDLGVIRPVGLADMTDHSGKPFVGTTRYSPPEFLMRDEMDSLEGWRAVTLYQLGGVLHDMIMREKLFRNYSDPPANLVQAVINREPIVKAPDVPQELILLARNCLLKSPEVRLKAVKWQDFNPRAGVRPGDIAKERIRRRMACPKPAVAPASACTTCDTDALDGVTRKLDMLVRQVLTTDMFPPREIRVREGYEEESRQIVITFPATSRFRLRLPCVVWLTVRPLDQSVKAIQLDCIAALSSSEDMHSSNLGGRTPTIVYQGIFEESSFRVILEDLFCILLDHAQQEEQEHADGENAELIWLDVPDGIRGGTK